MNAHVRDNLNALAWKAIIVSMGSPDGDALTTGVKARADIAGPCKITGWTIFSDAAGSVVVDVWKSDYDNFPPVVGGTITGSEKPTLSGAAKNRDLALTTWDDVLAAGDVLFFNIDSASTVKQVVVCLHLEPV